MVAARFVLRFCFCFIFIPAIVQSQNIQISPGTTEYIAGQPLVVRYSSLPGTPNNEFYLMFIFGGNGTDFYDSKPLRAVPDGSVEMRTLTKTGNYQFVIYRYKNYNDTRPQQMARVPFKIITAEAARKSPPKESTAQKAPEKPKLSPTETKTTEKPKADPVEAKSNTKPVKTETVKKESTRKPAPKAKTPAKETEKTGPVASRPVKQAAKEDNQESGKEAIKKDLDKEPAETALIETSEEGDSITVSNTSETGTGTYRAARIVIPKNVNARPPATSYRLIPEKTFNTNQEIVLNYEFPPLDSGAYYQVSLSKAGDHSGVNMSPILDTVFGSLKLKPLYEDGVYELRVFKGVRDAIVADSIVHRQPFTIGKLDKSYPGRYNCWPKKPYIAGTSNPNAPQPNELMPLFTRMMANDNVKPGLSLEDVCVEVQVIQYYPQTVVTFIVSDDAEDDLVYTAYPVRFVSRVVLNDYINKKSTLAEETKDRYYYFYRNEQTGSWEYTLQPGTQFRPF